MISWRYLSIFFIGMLIWGALFLGFIEIVNPYGVSPFRISSRHINNNKPKRLDIDRLIKPYEVWRYQPQTVFLGTSRIHQSLNPAVLDGTRYATAYNASIPASFLSMNEAQLRQYIELNKNLKFALVEMFFWDFIYPQNEVSEKNVFTFIQNSFPLHFSGGALWDAIFTVVFNLVGKTPGAYIHSRGHWVPPPGYTTDPVNWPQTYTDSIMRAHKNIPDMIVQPTALQALDRIVQLCRESGVTLYLIITPSYPFDDYRILSLGYWHLMEEWLRKLAVYPNVLSFSQYNAVLEEPNREKMEYWYDPIHFSQRFGSLMLRRLLGDQDPAIPTNLMLRVEKQNVEDVIAQRRKGLKQWAAKNPEFVAMFDKEKVESGNDIAQRKLRKP